MLIEELLKELKEYRNELVSKNYPFQRISNLIVKYDDKVADELSRQKNIQGKNCQEVVKQTYVQSTLENS